MKRKGLSLFLVLCLAIILLPATVFAIDATEPTLSGGSVWRSSATQAELRYMSDEDGTCYYQITTSATTPDNILADGSTGGAVTASSTSSLALSNLTSGPQYVHIVVQDAAGNVSDALTMAMPSNYYYFENFESYANNTTIASGSLSPLQQIHNGNGDANQLVTSSVGGNSTKMLSLSSSSSWASDQIVLLDSSSLAAAGTYVLEGDVYALANNNWQLRLSFTNGNYGAGYEAGIFFKNGNIVAIGNSERILQTDYTINQWYSVKLIVIPSQNKYMVYVDGTLLDDNLTLPEGINRLAITAGHGRTAYFDNLKFYTMDTVFSTDGPTWDGNAYDFELLDTSEPNSESNPYIIDTAGKLARLAQNVNNGNSYDGESFRITEDLDLNNRPWTPIGTSSTHFQGYVDGQNNTISNLTINSGAIYSGLFSFVGTNAVVESIDLTQVSITGGDYSGALAAYCYGIIRDCTVAGSVSGQFAVGGLVGQTYNGLLEECHSSATVTGTNEFAGGLVGYVFCTYGNSSLAVYRCSASGNVSGRGQTGGLIGCIQGSICRESYSVGTVTGSHRHTGGLLGALNAANDFTASVEDCYTRASVSAPDTQYVGGLIGSNWYGTVKNCYAANTISAANVTDVGGLTGSIYAGSITIDSYYDADISGLSDIGKGQPRSSTEMKDITTFNNWVFPTVWTMGSDNDNYPALAWQSFSHEADATISPTTTNFDKYEEGDAHVDRVITQNPNGNPLISILNGGNALVNGTDYIIAGNTITIKKEYLAAQAVGTTTLTFNYSTGIDPELTITIFDSTPASSHTLSINGSYASISGAGVYDGGDLVTINAGTRGGYQFSGWTITSGNLTLDNPTAAITTFTMPDHDVTVTANWRYKGSGSNSKDNSKGQDQDEDEPNTDNPSPNNNPFSDINKSNWFFEDIVFVYNKQLMIGINNRTFDPYGKSTRAMIVKILWQMEGSPAMTGSSGFADTPAGNWYSPAVAWAKGQKLVEGYDGNFGPTGEITRQQLATILYRYAEYKGYTLSMAGDLSGFSDADKIFAWAQEAMQWAVAAGLIEGKDNNILDPQGPVTRAEIAAIFHRLIEKYGLL